MVNGQTIVYEGKVEENGEEISEALQTSAGELEARGGEVGENGNVEANLENVGATATSAYLTKFEPVEVDVDAGEGLLLTVDATLSKVAPDPLPDVAEAETLAETPSTENASSEEVATDANAETPLEVETGNDAPSTDAETLAETAAEPETSEA